MKPRIKGCWGMDNGVKRLYWINQTNTYGAWFTVAEAIFNTEKFKLGDLK
mgnify:CR=1 FL=1